MVAGLCSRWVLRLTIDISPTLAAMLADPLLIKRTEAYMLRLADLLEKRRSARGTTEGS